MKKSVSLFTVFSIVSGIVGIYAAVCVYLVIAKSGLQLPISESFKTASQADLPLYFWTLIRSCFFLVFSIGFGIASFLFSMLDEFKQIKQKLEQKTAD